MREEGYYWVNVDEQDGWMIAHFSDGYWKIKPFSENEWTDSDFLEIDERRITRAITITIKEINEIMERKRIDPIC